MALYSNRQCHQSLHHSSCRSHTSSYHDTRNPHHSPLLLQSMACPRCSMSRRPRNARPKAAVGCGSSRLLSRSPTLCSYPCHTSGRPHSHYRCHNLLLLLCKHCFCHNSYLHRRRDPCDGGDSCCGRNNVCKEGEGDCDSDNDCEGDLKCGKDNCRGLGFDSTDDCCHNPLQPWGEHCEGGDSCCTLDKPCFEGEGDCDEDSECRGNLRCGTDNCYGEGFDDTDDCCTRPWQ